MKRNSKKLEKLLKVRIGADVDIDRSFRQANVEEKEHMKI